MISKALRKIAAQQRELSQSPEIPEWVSDALQQSARQIDAQAEMVEEGLVE